MANRKHLAILKQGTMVWNQWREKYPEIRPNLQGIMLWEDDLYTLIGINFSATNLKDADLSIANFTRADFTGANLRHTNLQGTIFIEAKLDKMDISYALLNGTVDNVS